MDIYELLIEIKNIELEYNQITKTLEQIYKSCIINMREYNILMAEAEQKYRKKLKVKLKEIFEKISLKDQK